VRNEPLSGANLVTRIITGDCRTALAGLADASVHTCVTSPPYFGLRDYGHAGQIGLEDSPQAFVTQLVEVFREVRRVLRDDGTLWLNLGDSYASQGGAKSTPHLGKHFVDRARGKEVISRSKRLPRGEGRWGGGGAPGAEGLKPKDLMGVPWRVAFALQDDGWYLRQDIIWSKPNPMPESVTDRCTKAHEYLFLLSKNCGDALLWRHRDTRAWAYAEPLPDYVWRHKKSRIETRELQQGEEWSRLNLWGGFDYYWDADAIAEPLGESSIARLAQDVAGQQGSERVPGKTNGAMKAVGRRAAGNKTHKGATAYEDGDDRMRTKAGLVDFAERERAKVEAGDLVGTRNKRSVWTVATQPFKEAHFATFPPALIEPCVLAGSPAGGVVLDPFGGAGTTGMVASRLQRDAILIELNPEYAALAERRIFNDAPLLAAQ
jgi:DNA modification methylase